MHNNRLYTLLLSFLLYVPGFSQSNEEMPIAAFWGVPDTMSNEKNFKDFYECGFTVSIYPYWQLETLVKACQIANKSGVKIIGRCPEMFDSPAKTALTLRKTNGFMGYMIQDEPSVQDMIKRQKEIERINFIDNTHLFYINLLPYYRQDWFTKAAKTETYQEYLKNASTLQCQQLSFDFYPITTEGIRSTWYHNLEMIRKESLSTNKPFWGFVLSTPHSLYPQPTLASLRLQVYSNLTYGAQAIQYFTYWCPTPKNFNYHDAPIDTNGKKTKTYNLVQKMNKELKEVSKLFYGAKVLSVHHLGNIPEGTTRQKTMPENISKLKITGRPGAIISQLEKDGARYLAIVNKNHEGTMKVDIKALNGIPRRISKSLQEERMKATYIVEAGDLLLFRIK